MKNHLLAILFLWSISFYGQIPSYYNGVDLSQTGNDLFLEISQKLQNTHVGIPYTGSSTDVWDACDQADEDPDISSNVILIYGFDNTDGTYSTDRTRLKTEKAGSTYIPGKWNREHVFAKSLAIPSFGTDEPGPGTDVHNLRPADQERNSARSNNKFTDGSGDSGIVSSNGGWYPGDEWKGDVARIIMYMYARYNGDGSKVSETKCLPINIGFGEGLDEDPNMIELFLKWNVEDPVSDFEANRNEVLAGIQGNRNPFIDNPYLATKIWGGLTAEDKWWSNNSSDTEAPTAPANLVASNITEETFDLSWVASTDNVAVYDYSIYLNGVYNKTATTTSTTITGLQATTTYSVTIKARDANSNYSEESEALNVSTLEGPLVVFQEDFNNCSEVKFIAYSEASTKNWECSPVYGENNSGSYGINGYQEAERSKDWLITNTSIDFDAQTGEKLSFYADEKFGSTPLELLYSTEYSGTGNPGDFEWISVPNLSIPIPTIDSNEVDVFYNFSDIDVSSISGKVYLAFKYYSDGEPTRWTVDNFEIVADQNDDVDGDGVLNVDDLCPNTPAGEAVNDDGCSNGQLDDDNDGVKNSDDLCADTPTGEDVNDDGCSQSQLDDDNDGVMNNIDECANTPNNEVVNAKGCSESQLDDDNDGVMNNVDSCPNSSEGSIVDASGCFTLPSNNFKIETIDETCPDKNNGQILISGESNYTYVATVNGTDYTFSKSSPLNILDLAPNLYDVCISVEGENYSQCFKVELIKKEIVSGKIEVASKMATISIKEGTAPYKVLVNGKTEYTTSSKSLNIEVNNGDLVEVETSVKCEGKLSKSIQMVNDISLYPNPTEGNFEIKLDAIHEKVTVELYSINSQLIWIETFNVYDGKIKLNLDKLNDGVYFVKLNLESPIMLKVIKE